jgi:succinate dehydrogenase / fumarate reductase flavoprotein subunit/L-aspartate oxidase
MVFGKRTGVLAAERAKSLPKPSLTLDHLKRFRAEAKRHHVSSGVISPMVLPAYTKK